MRGRGCEINQAMSYLCPYENAKLQLAVKIGHLSIGNCRNFDQAIALEYFIYARIRK